MLQTSATWRREMSRAKPEIRYRVEIDLEAGTTIRAVTGTNILPRSPAHEDDYPPSVLRVSAKSMGFDPWSRAPEMSERTIIFRADGFWREFIFQHVIKRRPIRVYKGTPAVPAAEWSVDWVGIVDDDSIDDDGTLSLSCLDMTTLVEDRKIRGYWYAIHPLALLVETLSPILFDSNDEGEDGNGIPRRFINASSFDEKRYPRISHWSTTRAGTDFMPPFNGAITEPVDAKDVIEQLLWLLGGCIRYDSEGRLEFFEYDRRRQPVRHLNRDQVRSCHKVESGGAINRLDFGGWPAESTQYVRAMSKAYRPSKRGSGPAFNINGASKFYRAEDETSQRRHALPGDSRRILSAREDSEWIRAQGNIRINGFVASISGASEAGFCGCRWRNPDAAQDYEDSIGVAQDRFLYVLTDRGEVIELETFGAVGTQFTVNATGARYRYQSEFNIGRRNINNAVDDNGDPISGDYQGDVYDVTIYYARSQDIIPRWAYGAPCVEIGVAVENADLQPGDFISFDHDNYAHVGTERATHRTVWEIVDVTDNTGEDDPEISLTCTRAYVKTVTETLPPGAVDAEPDTDPIRFPRVPPPEFDGGHMVKPAARQLTPASRIAEQFRDASETENTFRRLVPLDALEVSDAGALMIAVGGGSAEGTQLTSPAWAGPEIAVIASRDNWIYHDTQSGHTMRIDTTVDADAPTVDARMVPLARVTTDGSGVTAIVDLRNPTPSMKGVDIIDADIPGRAGTKHRAGRRRTANNTPATALSIDVADLTSGTIKVKVTGYREADGFTGMWEMTARLRNDGTGARLYDQVTSVVSRDNEFWDADLDVSGDSVRVRVTGTTSATINWTASAELSVADVEIRP